MSAQIPQKPDENPVYYPYGYLGVVRPAKKTHEYPV